MEDKSSQLLTEMNEQGNHDTSNMTTEGFSADEYTLNSLLSGPTSPGIFLLNCFDFLREEWANFGSNE